MSIRALLIAGVIMGVQSLGYTEPLKNYISLDLAYPYYKRIFDKLDSKLKTGLVTRGEAHITLVTPPEFKVLATKIPVETLHQMADKFIKTIPSFEHVCLGLGEKFGAGKTYYIAIKSADFLIFRETLARLSQLPKTIFDPNKFYPHVTLGFTQRDLHIDDGIVKNSDSCPGHLQSLLKEKSIR